MNKSNGEFSDPILRCDSCSALVRRTTPHNLGSCDKCGNKRMRALDIFNEDEQMQIKNWGFEDFLSEFQEIPDE